MNEQFKEAAVWMVLKRRDYNSVHENYVASFLTLPLNAVTLKIFWATLYITIECHRLVVDDHFGLSLPPLGAGSGSGRCGVTERGSGQSRGRDGLCLFIGREREVTFRVC